jgi:predicted nucleic acid-binding protein
VILVDTSVWVDHLRRSNAGLTRLLEDQRVACHPFVMGEIALGHLRQRKEILRLLSLLPAATQATDSEVLALIEAEELWGVGMGYIDAHLLAAARLAGVRLWTDDRRLAAVAARLDVLVTPHGDGPA